MLATAVLAFPRILPSLDTHCAATRKRTCVSGILTKVWQFGDWPYPASSVDSSGQTWTDGTFIAESLLVQSTKRMAAVADTLQSDTDAIHYEEVPACSRSRPS
jgi:hypothetical protein